MPFLTLKYGGDTFTGTAIISIYALAAFAIGPIWGKISDRIGRKPTLAFTFLGGALAYLMLAFSTSLWMVFLARAISGAMSGNIGIVMAVMADLTDEENRGKAMGRIGGAFGLGFAFGPGLGGYLSSIGGENSIFLPGMAAFSLSLLALVLTAIFVPETNAETVRRNNKTSSPRSPSQPIKGRRHHTKRPLAGHYSSPQPAILIRYVCGNGNSPKYQFCHRPLLDGGGA